MSRHPVVLTSLEEDFKALGLINDLEEEGDPAPQHKKAPKGDPATNAATKSRNVGDLSDDPSNKGGDEHDSPSISHQGSTNTKTHPAGPDPKKMKESLKGMPDSIRGKNGGKAKPVSEEEDEDEKKDDEDEDEEDDKEESVDVRGADAVNEAVRNMRGGSPAITESHSPKFAQVASLIEDVNSIMESIDTGRRDETVKAFANIGIVSEMLARGFANFAEEYEDEDLANAALALSTLSEDATSIAEGLNEGEEVDQEALEAEFRDEMDALINGLDLYSDVVESDAELEEEEGLEEEDDEDEKDSDDDEDDSDDDEDEKDESVDEEEVDESAPLGKAGFAAARSGMAGTDKSIKDPKKAAVSALDRLKAAKGEAIGGPLSRPFVTKPKKDAKPMKESPLPRSVLVNKGKGGATRPASGAGAAIARGGIR